MNSDNEITPMTIRRGSNSNNQQTHTHEFVASTKLAVQGINRHNHRFAGVTSEAIPLPSGNHIHQIKKENTDFFLSHFHEVIVRTGPAIIVNPKAPENEQKHVHFVEGETTLDADHTHNFTFATLIEDPLLPLEG